MNRFQEPCNEKSFEKKKAFEKSSKSSGVFRTHARIYNGAFLWIYLSALYYRNISSIIDLRLGYIWACENIEIFKVKLRWRKSSRLLQRIAFLVFELNCLYWAVHLGNRYNSLRQVVCNYSRTAVYFERFSVVFGHFLSLGIL